MIRPLAKLALVPARHAPAEEYAAYLEQRYPNPETRRQLQLAHRRFVEAYPDLETWLALPLVERVGRLHGAGTREYLNPVSYGARQYLYFLAWQRSITLDWDWLIAVPDIHLRGLLQAAGQAEAVEQLVGEAIHLGYTERSAEQRMTWLLYRLLLRHHFPPVTQLSEEQCHELTDAARQFGQRPDVALFFGSLPQYHKALAMIIAATHKLHVVLYHRGQAATEPRVIMPHRALWPGIRPVMEQVAQRYIAMRRLTDRPGTIIMLDVAMRHFITWIAQAHPSLVSLAEITRAHLLEFAEHLNTMTCERTGGPLATLTKRGRLANLSHCFRDLAAWEWEETPGRPLLGAGDLPKIPQRIPRYIPEEDLSRLMTAIRGLGCPYQRAALLIARWSGARRGEIRRLPIDCLDRYPDGSWRLRIPAGKTKRERVIPLHEEAASAISTLQALRRGERGLRDEHTGVPTRYLFMHYGKLYSVAYLFDTAMQVACEAAGLVDAQGKGTLSAHRFRHTLGTQLAERGAKLNTIMKILGHTSATMSMVYAQISDPEVRKEYQAVLGPGATIAGPFAETLRAGELPLSAVDWLQTNFFKTELELGRCLRLPQEGPCECELYLSCAKFITTPAYAPRLRRRRKTEALLIEDALARGWEREAERHRSTVRRIDHLLADLGEPLDGPEAEH